MWKKDLKLKIKYLMHLLCGDFLVWGSALPVLLDIYFFLLIWILTGIPYHNFSFITLIEIWILLNLYWENVLLFIFLLKFLNLQHFFMVVSSYIPSLKHELKSKEIKTFVFQIVILEIFHRYFQIIDVTTNFPIILFHLSLKRIYF